MIDTDTVHRVFLDNLLGPRARPVDLKGFYFLGANARSYISALYRIELGKRDWLANQDDLGDWRAVYPWAEAHNLIAGLLPRAQGPELSWSAKNWVGGHLLPRYRDPLRRSSRLRAHGLVALNYRQEYLLPFLYLVDNGSLPSDELRSALTAPLDLRRSGQLTEVFPDLDPDISLPIVVISTTEERRRRVAALRPEVDTTGLLALGTGDLDFLQPAVTTLFSSRQSAPRSLFEALVSHWQGGAPGGPMLTLRPQRKAAQ